MALSILISPQNPADVYNSFYYVLSGSNSTKHNFKFVCDVFEGVTNPTAFVGRFNIAARPSDKLGIFSPARVIENYVQSKITPTATGLTECYESQHVYNLKFYEAYDDYLAGGLTAATGVTIYYAQSAQTSSKNVLNSCSQYGDTGLSPMTARTFIAMGSACKMLTDWNEAYPKKIRRGEYETIGAYRMLCNQVNIETFNSGFTFISTHGISDGWNANVDRYNLPTGTQNLSSGGTIINSNVHYYIVTFTLNGTQRSVQYGYLIDDSCLKYSPVRIAWLNRYGAHDYWTFEGKSINQIEYKNNEWEQNLYYGWAIGDRGRTLLNKEVKKKITVSTGFLTDYESAFLQNCFSSPEHFIINSSGVALPMILIDAVPEERTVLNNKLFSYQLTFDYAYNINTQRT